MRECAIGCDAPGDGGDDGGRSGNIIFSEYRGIATAPATARTLALAHSAHSLGVAHARAQTPVGQLALTLMRLQTIAGHLWSMSSTCGRVHVCLRTIPRHTHILRRNVTTKGQFYKLPIMSSALNAIYAKCPGHPVRQYASVRQIWLMQAQQNCRGCAFGLGWPDHLICITDLLTNNTYSMACPRTLSG